MVAAFCCRLGESSRSCMSVRYPGGADLCRALGHLTIVGIFSGIATSERQASRLLNSNRTRLLRLFLVGRFYGNARTSRHIATSSLLAMADGSPIRRVLLSDSRLAVWAVMAEAPRTSLIRILSSHTSKG